MSNVKLHINITQGIIDAEGDREFVWRVYEDFRHRLVERPPQPSLPVGAEEGGHEEPSPTAVTFDEREEKSKKRNKRRSATSQTSGSKEKGAATLKGYRPKLLTDLDTSGIKDFLAKYQLTNHTDNIVAMTKFLASKGESPARFDAFFTCYADAGLKVPEAFAQAFIRARGGKNGFISFATPHDVELTLRGSNHIEHGGIKKVEA